MAKPHSKSLSAWQNAALRDLRAIAKDPNSPLRSVDEEPGVEDNVHVRLRLDTSRFTPVARHGLPVRDEEEVLLAIEPHEWQPPTAYVTHARFIGHPHVLNGYVLCLYLDPSREYRPDRGITGVLNRLFHWLEDATQGNFDADTALYHAVGGVPHLGKSGPTIVVREPLATSRRVFYAYLHQRTPCRYDLQSTRVSDDDLPVPVIHLDHDLPLGAGRDRLSELLNRLDFPVLRHSADLTALAALRHRIGLRATLVAETLSMLDWNQPRCPQAPRNRARYFWDPDPVAPPSPTRPSSVLLTALAATAARQAPGSEVRAILSVPHPRHGPTHLIALRLPAEIGNALRYAVANRNTPLISVRSSLTDPHVPMAWTRISDERAAVTQRRDKGRPVTNFAGKTVHIWGVGGIGSWIAEFVVRAAPRKVVLCDPGLVAGGLLVRQNYLEANIGENKALALKERLEAIADGIEIVAEPDAVTAMLNHSGDTDLIIDATVNRAVGQMLDTVAAQPRTATLAQVATDTRTGTLGLLSVSAPGEARGPNGIDEASWKTISANSALERYHAMWQDPLPGDEFVPTRGCSVPTFHGSAADLAAVAASLTTLIGTHLATNRSGTHLIALPHSGVKPAHHWEPAA